MLTVHADKTIPNPGPQRAQLVAAAKAKNHAIRQFVRKWKNGKPTADISNSSPLTLKNPRLLYAENLPRELTDLQNYAYKTFLDGYDLVHGNTYGSAHFFNFTFLADSARQSGRVDTLFRLYNFCHPHTNAHGLYLKLAYAFTDQETHTEVGEKRLGQLLETFVREPIDFTMHYRAPGTQAGQETWDSPPSSTSHQWFRFEYHAADPNHRFVLEEGSLLNVLRWLVNVGAIQTIPGPPPERKPLYRLKRDVPDHWTVGFLDSLGKKARDFPVNEQINLCSRHTVYFEYSRFTFGRAKLWCKNCFTLQPVPLRYACEVCLDTLYGEDPRLAMLEGDGARKPFYCFKCEPPTGRGCMKIKYMSTLNFHQNENIAA